MVSLIKHDLEFILKQIKVAEAHSAGGDLASLVGNPLVPYGLRTVSGVYNNLVPGSEYLGSSDQIMPRLLDPDFNAAEQGTSYEQSSGSVYDSQPRTISNLISDQTIGNPAVIIAALTATGHADPYATLLANQATYDVAVDAYKASVAAEKTLAVAQASKATLFYGPPPSPAAIAAADAAIAAAQGSLDQANALKAQAYEDVTDDFGLTIEGDTVVIPNVSADLGDTAPFNGFFTLFGQFFDHGLDLVSKGGSGAVYIPLQPDDPLYVPGSPTNFMVLTRAQNQPGADGVLGTADDVHEHTNETTPFIDLNQVYTSNPSHQVFLREYAMVDGKPVATGRMLEGAMGGREGAGPRHARHRADGRRRAARACGADRSLRRVRARRERLSATRHRERPCGGRARCARQRRVGAVGGPRVPERHRPYGRALGPRRSRQESRHRARRGAGRRGYDRGQSHCAEHVRDLHDL